jgi:hypothetical protein
MLQNLPNLDLMLAASALSAVAVGVRFALRRRRPKFLYGERQSVASIQQARRHKTFTVKDDFDSQRLSPSR